MGLSDQEFRQLLKNLPEEERQATLDAMGVPRIEEEESKPETGSEKSKLEAKLHQQIQLVGLPEPQTEFRFHDTRRWRADFAWPDRKVLVEVEGGIYSGGRHVRGKGYEKDCEKYNEAALAGYTLIRVTPKFIKNGKAIEWIGKALEVDDDTLR